MPAKTEKLWSNRGMAPAAPGIPGGCREEFTK